MILFHNVVEILDLADFDRGVVCLIVALDGGCIGRTPVDGDLLWHAMAADRLGQKSLGHLLVPVLREEEVDGLARLVDGAVEIIPLAFDLDVGFVHAPTHPHRALAPVDASSNKGLYFTTQRWIVA